MNAYGASIWKKVPFFRLLVALIAGIILQWYVHVHLLLIMLIIFISFVSLFFFHSLRSFIRFRYRSFPGIPVFLLVGSLGLLLTYLQDIRNDKSWFVNYYDNKEKLIVFLEEPLHEKPRSLKAIASVIGVIKKGEVLKVKGKVILYFRKDSLKKHNLNYGSVILFDKSLQRIRNSGNPGAFDFERYSLFQGTTYQAFLSGKDYTILSISYASEFRSFLFYCRNKILKILREYIRSEKEIGLAEALLIGYKDDLDKSLIAAYSNTGVVHVIAISGLHLGLIYGILLLITGFLNKFPAGKIIKPIIIIVGLWLFTLVAGAQPSVLRSALMFTCLVVGKSFREKNQFLNTLTFSAFLLLCINPFTLWDAGFQLSYAAVTSIYYFMRPIYNWFYFPNKIVDAIWKLNAVTISAQVLTTPVSMFHFHQFPNFFLLANLVAVPLSSIILLFEIALCLSTWWHSWSKFLGDLIVTLIKWMNDWVGLIEEMPAAVLKNLHVSFAQALLLTFFICSISFWLIEKQKSGLWGGFIALVIFLFLRIPPLIQAKDREQLIVYDLIPNPIIDIIQGRKFFTLQNQKIDGADSLQLEQTRGFYGVSKSYTLPGMQYSANCIDYKKKKILFIGGDSNYSIQSQLTMDVVIIAGTGTVNLGDLTQSLHIKQIVVTRSVPTWTTIRLGKEARQRKIRFHDIRSEGAFVMNLH